MVCTSSFAQSVQDVLQSVRIINDSIQRVRIKFSHISLSVPSPKAYLILFSSLEFLRNVCCKTIHVTFDLQEVKF